MVVDRTSTAAPKRHPLSVRIITPSVVVRAADVQTNVPADMRAIKGEG
jgi:hypothetical protein